MFYPAELSEYSYHVEEQAVLAKYSSCVPVTWTMKKKEGECVEAKEQEARKERRKVGLLECEGIRHAIAFMAAGWQHDTA